MNTSNETNNSPLVERITDGPVEREYNKIVAEYTGYVIATLGAESARRDANAEFIVEAFNVTHETGKTPRQLADALKAEKDAQEAFAIRAMGQEAYDNSPCQAHPLELAENHLTEQLKHAQVKEHDECADAWCAKAAALNRERTELIHALRTQSGHDSMSDDEILKHFVG